MCLIDQKFGGLHQRTWRICVSYRIPRERNPFPHPHDLFQVKLKFSSIGLPGGDGLKGIMAQNKMQSIDFKMQNKGRNGQLGLDLSWESIYLLDAAPCLSGLKVLDEHIVFSERKPLNQTKHSVSSSQQDVIVMVFIFFLQFLMTFACLLTGLCWSWSNAHFRAFGKKIECAKQEREDVCSFPFLKIMGI